jgi:hypothetical protein
MPVRSRIVIVGGPCSSRFTAVTDYTDPEIERLRVFCFRKQRVTTEVDSQQKLRYNGPTLQQRGSQIRKLKQKLQKCLATRAMQRTQNMLRTGGVPKERQAITG